MVEIKRTDAVLPTPSVLQSPPGGEKHRLVYSKSKVYVNPTAYARDNIPGFVVLVKREIENPTFLLAWIPETLLNEKGATEWDKFTKVEDKSVAEEDEDVVFIDLPSQRPESYAFSVPLTSIYSLVLRPPTFSSWHGSVVINLINGETLPTLHFHDDESRSYTQPSQKSSPPTNQQMPATYPPPLLASSSSGSSTTSPKSNNSWGGEDLLSRLRSYSHILRSTLQPSLFLIDPSRADIETHSVQLFDDDAVDDILAQSSYANSHSPVPSHRRPRPLSTASVSGRNSVLHESLASPSTTTNTSSSQARMALLQSFSNITRATRHAAQSVLSHPLAKPIVPHLPDPVKSLVNANEWGSWVEKGGVGEFESARVYLARWARIVAEEGERARRREAQALPSSTSNSLEEPTPLGVFELLQSTANLPTPVSTRVPERPIDEEMWAAWFGGDGKPSIGYEEFKKEVFRRGVSSEGTLRQKVWPFILGVHEWDATTKGREKLWEDKKRQYYRFKGEWCGNPEVFERTDIIDERHRIDVDCRRTDRTQPLFIIPEPNVNSEKPLSKHFTISPQVGDIGAQAPSNENVDCLGGILLTYGFYEKELGYVQGMSDLCAPVYVVMNGNEEMTFWCFVEVMKRMNFLRDQSGMKSQLMALQQLIRMMDPELYRHLEKTDGLNLFFCFRWVLISFKREFPFDQVLRLWEVLWTDYYSIHFVLFVALAVLESHRDMMLRYLVEFDEILKYCNELSMTIELDSTLAQAEVLFLSFSQLIDDIDRRKAEELSPSTTRRRGANSSTSGTANIELPELSELLRGLLLKHREE